MAISKSERLRRVHQRAMREFQRIQAAQRSERMQCLADRRFYSIAGAQWEGSLAEQFANKPKFEVNKVHLAVIRVISEYRNNRISVDFTPKDGSKADELADTCDSLYRADEQDSCAEEAKDNAFEEAVGGGFGAYRLRACYEDELDDENTRQRIKFEPIVDADRSVFFDLDAKRQDKSDATKVYVLHSCDRTAHIEEYPDDDPASWPQEITMSEFDWQTPDVIYKCEYYEREEVTEVVHVFLSLDGEEMLVPQSELDADPDKLGILLATGFRHLREKRTKRIRWHKYLMSGGSILEDEGYIAGPNHPIIVVYGKRWFVDNVERCMGIVRLAKDPQRLGNMQRSRLGEIAALSPVEKPIVTPEQMAGHALLWAEDNIKNNPYLFLNPMTDVEGNPMPAGPIGYTKPPQVPPAMAALLQITEQDLQDVLGNPQAGEKMVSNIAEKTVEMIQQRLDMQTFLYISNMAKAEKRAGEVWLGMAQELYNEEGRTMKTVAADYRTVDSVELMTPVFDPKTGEQSYENDLGRAKLDVAVEVGPSSASKRNATVRALMNMMSTTQDPETLQVLSAMVMLNMEGEGIGEVRDFFRQRLLRMGAIKPTEEEAEEMAAEQQNAPPDPQTQYLQAEAERATAEAADNRAATIVKVTQAEKNRADTAKTLSEIDAEEVRVAIDAGRAIREAATPPPGIEP